MGVEGGGLVTCSCGQPATLIVKVAPLIHVGMCAACREPEQTAQEI